MPITLNDVLPATPATPAAPQESDGGGSIPEQVLEIPEFSALLEGKPAAVSIQKGTKTPETETIMANAQPLADAGFGFYPSKDGVTAVFFNTQYISGDEIKKADEEGKLQEVSTPFEELKGSFDTVLGRQSGGEAPQEGAAPAQPPVPPQSASADKKLASARLKNVTEGSPTSGPTPGQGRLLSNIVKPVI